MCVVFLLQPQSTISSADVTDVEEDTEQTQPDTELPDDPQPSTSATPDPAVTPAPRNQLRKKGKRTPDSTDTALESLAQYFGTKVPESKEKLSAEDDDSAFGKFVSVEIRKIRSSKVKRELKRKITEALFDAQGVDDDEYDQQQMQQSLFVVDEQGNLQPLLAQF